METKLSKLLAHAKKGEWQEALRIAARFPQLGDQKAAILRAHEAYGNAAFYRQIGRNPDALIADGIAALKTRYMLIGEHNMTTTLTAADICAAIAATGTAAPKRPNSKDAAVKALTACMAAITGNDASATKAVAAILACASASPSKPVRPISRPDPSSHDSSSLRTSPSHSLSSVV